MQQNSTLIVVPHKANLLLQILLFLNVYLSGAWVLIFGFNICYNFSEYDNPQRKLLIVVVYMLATSGEAVRLYKGYSGNLRSNTGDLSIFLLLVPILQLPTLLFLLLYLSTHIIARSISYVQLFFMFIEFIVGIYVWCQHADQQSELQQYRLQTALQKRNKFLNK